MEVIYRAWLPIRNAAVRVANVGIRMWIHFCRRTTGREKCPGCGQRKQHKVIWRGEYERLIHQCAFCTAVWGTDPLVSAQAWRVEIVAPPEPGPEALQRMPFGASREPSREPLKHEMPIQS